MADQKAIALYALYAGLFELGGLAGGMIADRFLGLRRALLLGALLIATGHIVFAFQGGFYAGLAWIVAGSALFSPSITALLARMSQEGERERNFTYFYVVMNVGALLSTIICPLLAHHFGWHFGFGAAAVGMLIGLSTLLMMRIQCEESATKPMIGIAATVALFGLAYGALHLEEIVLPILPLLVIGIFIFMVRKYKKVIGPLIALVLFFAVEEQMGSSLLLFAERNVSSQLPMPILMATNPVVVLLFGTVVAKIKGRARLVLPFALVGLVFALLGGALFLNLVVTTMGMIAVFAVISFSELLIGPYVYSSVAEVSTKGTVMGLVPLGFSLASLMGGGIAKGVNHHFGWGFIVLALLLILTSIIMGRKNGYHKRSRKNGAAIDGSAI